MKPKGFLFIVGLVFTVITALHFLRIIFQWEAAIEDWDIPFWFNWLFGLVAAFLAVYSFRLWRK